MTRFSVQGCASAPKWCLVDLPLDLCDELDPFFFSVPTSQETAGAVLVPLMLRD